LDLYQDGTIELEVKLTGIVLTGAAPEPPQGYGVEVAPGLWGPNHQHHFCVRLDASVDGIANCVEEINSQLVPEDELDGVHGSAWRFERRVLRSEQEAQRNLNTASARHWRIINRTDEGRHFLSGSTGYRLEPGETAPLLQRPGSPNGRRALFATRNLWVTRYHPNERFPAGDYPNQHSGGAGLPDYAADDETLEDTDLVVWYSFGAHHIVRPEDWPVMPVTRIGFRLRPDGFFAGNPALDLPPSARHCHHQESSGR
jgi:primary-amine oxidase